MRTLSLCCIMVLLFQYAFCQSSNATTASILRRKVSLQTPLIPRSFDPELADKRLRTARRCIISGSVLTGIGGAFMVAGTVYVLIPKPRPVVQPGQSEPHYEDPTAPALWICGIPFLAPGIPVLAIGLVQRKKWKNIQNDVTVQTGILNDGQLGMAMTF